MSPSTAIALGARGISANHGSRSPVARSYARTSSNGPPQSPSIATAREPNTMSVALARLARSSPPAPRSVGVDHGDMPDLRALHREEAPAQEHLPVARRDRAPARRLRRPAGPTPSTLPGREVERGRARAADTAHALEPPPMNIRSPEIARSLTCPSIAPGPQSRSSPVAASSAARFGRRCAADHVEGAAHEQRVAVQDEHRHDAGPPDARNAGSIDPSASRCTSPTRRVPEHAVELAADVEPAGPVGRQRRDLQLGVLERAVGRDVRERPPHRRRPRRGRSAARWRSRRR